MQVTDCSFTCSGHSYVQLFKMCIWKQELMSPFFFVCSEYKSLISIFDVNGTFSPIIKNAYFHVICNAIIILLYIVLVGDTELKKY